MGATMTEPVGEFLNKVQAARYMGFSISSLRRLSLCDKSFPRPKRIVRRDMYRRADLDEWKNK